VSAGCRIAAETIISFSELLRGVAAVVSSAARDIAELTLALNWLESYYFSRYRIRPLAIWPFEAE